MEDGHMWIPINFTFLDGGWAYVDTYRYPHMPILHLDYGAKKLLFLVHKNNCIFIGKKLIEVKLRELNKHIIRCLKHHIGNLTNLTFFIRQVIPFLFPSLFQKYKIKKRTALQTKGLIAS